MTKEQRKELNLIKKDMQKAYCNLLNVNRVGKIRKLLLGQPIEDNDENLTLISLIECYISTTDYITTFKFFDVLLERNAKNIIRALIEINLIHEHECIKDLLSLFNNKI